MDIDRYVARNQPSWDRLTDLSTRARRSLASLAPGELDELIQLYQRASAQLSYVRTYYNDSALTARLTRLVATANGVIYGKRARTLAAFGEFFAYTFPGAVYQYRRYVWVTALMFVGTWLAVWIWMANSPAALDASASPAEREMIVRDRFEQYYSESPHPVFFTEVTTNNIRVSFAIFGSGIVAPVVGPTFVLTQNAWHAGEIGAYMTEAGETDRFLGFILPHGMLEITAVIISGAAGLALGWSVIAPGDRRRGDALREEGRRLIVIIIGLTTMFLAAGLIEGFITGSGLPVAPRVGIGAVGWLAYVTYLVAQGRAAAARGNLGTIKRRRRTWDDEPTFDLSSRAVVMPDGWQRPI